MTESTGASRWHLHRGGVVNIWHYAVEEFDLSGGRAILQGTNGSGKSRTLELLLPLCLDGDLHHLGSKGYDTVSMKRLMLDDYVGGPNRIGYAWIELHRDRGDTDEYVTAGLGIKASASAQALTSSWRFLTRRRMGHDVDLVVDDAPLGESQLRDVLGNESVYGQERGEQRRFQAEVAEYVYGLPATRYDDLLHLQRTLRNPDVGIQVGKGRLEQILSDSLPPLDSTVTQRLAQSFEDLQSIRENVHTLSSTAEALETFVSTYSGYALGELRKLGRHQTDTQTSLAAARGDLRDMVERRDDDRAHTVKLEAEAEELEARDRALEQRIADFKRSTRYQKLSDFEDLKRALDSVLQTAVGALKNARARRRVAEQAVETIAKELRRLDNELGQGQNTARQVAGLLRDAGLDPLLCPTIPDTPRAETPQVHDSARVTEDPLDDPVEIARPEPPELDLVPLVTELETVTEHARHAVTVLTERAALAMSLSERSVQMDTMRNEADQLRQAHKDAARTAREAADARDTARQHVENVAHAWRDAVLRWGRTGPLASADHPIPELEPPEIELLVTDRDATSQARARARAWMTDQLGPLRSAVRNAEHELAQAETRLREVENELTELESGRVPEPDRPTFTTAPRDPAHGAAFYRLVDFDPQLDEQGRAGLEAALESSGVLNAWVTADGHVADDTGEDLYAALPTAAATHDHALDSLLVPAVPPESPVPEHVVQALLRRVPLTEVGGGLAVSTTGRWWAGILTGAMTKPAAEYIGAETRERARRRRITDLTHIRATLTARLEECAAALHNTHDRVQAWEDHTERYEQDRDLLAAHIAKTEAIRAAEDASGKALAARDEHAAARDRLEAKHAELAAEAHAAGLRPTTEALRAAHHAADSAKKQAQHLIDTLTRRCVPAVHEVTAAIEAHTVARDELLEADTTANNACIRYAADVANYRRLLETIDDTPQQVEAELTAMEDERAAVKDRLPTIRKRARETGEKAARSEAKIDEKERRIGELRENDDRARRHVRDALAVPGVWAAALGTSADPPEDLSKADELLTGEGRATASEDDVLAAVRNLQTAVAGTDDITTQRQAGILTVTVTGTHGSKPAPEASREVSTRLEEQRSLLSEEYQTIFDTYMLRDLVDKLAEQVSIAEDLCRRMNKTLTEARSSQGVHVQLDWKPSAALDDAMREALQLIRTPLAKRTPEQDDRLRTILTERIAEERDSFTGTYAEVLERTLDYRGWYQFTVRVRDKGPDGQQRTRRVRELSSGETRLVSYVTLFGAASAFYDAVSTATEQSTLRLVLLDEAFERLDDPTIARMLELLVQLDMDWVITWPSGWGLSPKIPRMHIYDVLRPEGGRGIACTHTLWTGSGLLGEQPR